jgi:lactoylglutathione lyase
VSAAAVNHLGQCVTDLERSKRFYTGLLGFTLRNELRLPDAPSDRLLRIEPPVNMAACYLERDGLVLELLWFDRPGNPAYRPRVMNEPGLTHLSFSVDDVDATLARVADLGGEVLDDTNLGGMA